MQLQPRWIIPNFLEQREFIGFESFPCFPAYPKSYKEFHPLLMDIPKDTLMPPRTDLSQNSLGAGNPHRAFYPLMEHSQSLEASSQNFSL